MEYFSSVTQYFPGLKIQTLVGVLGILGFATALLARSGSSYVFWEFWWQRSMGKGDFHNQKLKKFSEEMRDLERFRFVYRLNVETICQAEVLTKWLDQHNIGARQARKAGGWFEITDTAIAVKTVSKRYRRFISTILVVSVVATWGGMCFTGYDRALLKMNVSDVWFTTDAQTVAHVLWGQTVNLTVCSYGPDQISKTFRFSKAEVEVLCVATKNGSLASFVKESIRQQHRFGVALGIIGIIGTMLCYAPMSRINAADQLRKRIHPPSSDETSKTNIDSKSLANPANPSVPTDEQNTSTHSL